MPCEDTQTHQEMCVCEMTEAETRAMQLQEMPRTESRPGSWEERAPCSLRGSIVLEIP